MTKLLHVITDSNPKSGGPIEAARRFAAIWAAEGHESHLLTLDAPGEQWLTDYPGEIFAVGEARNDRPLNGYRYAPRFVPWLRAHAKDYDAVLVSGLWGYHALGARRALTNGPVPYFVFTHGMLDPWFRRAYPLKHLVKQALWLFSEGPLLAGAERVLFTCAEEMRVAQNAFWPWRAKGAVVGYGTDDLAGDVDLQRRAFRAAMPGLGQRPFVLFLSRIHPKKGCDLLIDAFAKVAAQAPDLDIVIAGPDQVGLTAALAERAARLKVQGRVHFPGMLTGDVKVGALREAAAFVLPSHQENFGIAVAEAMAAGIPVLISDKVNIWREIAADGAGIVAPDDAAGALYLLKGFLKLKAEARTKMGARARESYLKRFQLKSAAVDLMTLIEHHI